MPLFRKKPVVIEASQWFKNGDHPDDNTSLTMRTTLDILVQSEGKVVRYFRNSETDGFTTCKHCGIVMHLHGWIDTLEGGHIVCPGDWVIIGVKGERYPCKPDIFEMTYESEE